ncbi:MAG: serine/threonine-protein kinase [Proteobacteria bacterium]|nr:serine/threonine-protein kinase [Pseudomonadota bacterium]
MVKAAATLSSSARSTFLRDECADNIDLRREVESRLVAQQQNARNVRKEALFFEAISLQPGECAAYLIRACADDPELGREVAQLVERDRQREARPQWPAALQWLDEELMHRVSLGRGELIGRYVVLHKVGAGGQGAVYVAYDSELDRQVAIKIVHTRLAGRARKRLAREARALARLSHPNVVQVIELDDHNGLVFLAMELVTGTSLQEWYKSDPGWPEVLRVSVDAARGVAAAHAKGIIHRDIKPSNLLLGDDGRARVVDFGLAAAHQSSVAEQYSREGHTHCEDPARAGDDPPATSEPLTATGEFMGTLHYMAPEQHMGDIPGPAADQYSFCVSLYQGLYGTLPFPATEPAELLKQKLDDELSVPADSDVPVWLYHIVKRGLAVAPEDRYPSMDALITALESNPSERRRAWMRNATLAAISGVVTALLLMLASTEFTDPGQACQGLAQELQGIWDPDVKAQVQSVFVATGVGNYALDTSRRVASILDEYASSWLALRTEACEATAGGEAHLTAVMHRTIECLDRRRDQLDALVELYATHANRELVSKAVQAARALWPIDYCADIEALMAVIPPPEDPRVRARVEGLQNEVDRLEFLFHVGQYQRGVARGEALLTEVSNLGYAPINAQIAYHTARLKNSAGDHSGAEVLLEEAISLAAKAKDDVLLARVLAKRLEVVGWSQGRPNDALPLVAWAMTAADRADDDLVRSEILSRVANVLHGGGDYEGAKLRYERALAIREALLGPDHPEVATLLNDLSQLLYFMGDYGKAKAGHERALAIRERVLGPEHPDVAASLGNLARILSELGKYEQARRIHERALAIRERVLGPEHPTVAASLNGLGIVLWQLGHYAEARAKQERALIIQEKVMGPAHPDVAQSLHGLGLVLSAQAEYQEATRRHERALAIREKVLGPEHPLVAISLSNLAFVLRQLGNYNESLARYQRALAIREQALGPDHSEVATLLNNQGRVLWSMGKYRASQDRYERALAISEKAFGSEHPTLAYELTGLGRALVAQGKLAAARPHLQRALWLFETGLGPDHPKLAWPLLGLAEFHLARDRPSASVRVLQRALMLAEESARVEVQLTLARALWRLGTDRKRAIALARQARDTYRRHGNQPMIQKASRWLAER